MGKVSTEYPTTNCGDVVEILHGREIADPYRWLEDPDSAETKDWVERQRHFTEDFLVTLPERAWFSRMLSATMERPRAMIAYQVHGWYFVSRNNGRQAQNVVYVAKTLAELESGGRVLFDPNTWSEDGSVSLQGFHVSPNGRYAAYIRSEAGSDWQHIHVCEIATGADVEDVEVVSKFSSPAWLPDSESFLYHAYHDVERTEGTNTEALPCADLKVHKIGRALADDPVIWASEGDPMLFTHGYVTHDHRWLVVVQSWGTERSNSLWLHPIHHYEVDLSTRIDLCPERDAHYWPVRTVGDDLLIQTDLDAPNMRLVRCPIAPRPTFVEVIPEGEHPLAGITPAGDELLVERQVDALTKVSRYSLNGEHLGDVDVAGTIIVTEGEEGCDDAFIGTSTVVSPYTTWHLDLRTGKVRQLSLILGDDTFPTPEIRTERRRATSKDGTEVPYWLITRADLPLGEAPRPTLVYGYGGFDAAVTPSYNYGWPAWVKAGGCLVIANLRGGGEFGRTWYDGGRGVNKQNVFDDVNAVGEHLCETGVASPVTLAIHGRSNGGLLVGAAMTQRPDLWRVALPVVGVLDLLRFHKFTGGLAWASDYGNPDVAEDFEVALAYSPLHNVRAGVEYPATLISTGDHDDRVVPLHSYKFAAALQRAQAGELPVLTRIESATGHGMGKSAAKVGAEWADLLAFAAHFTGLDPEAANPA